VGIAEPWYGTSDPWERKSKMSKEQRNNREKKKPKQDKSVKAAAPGSAYAQSFKTKGSKK
jgi:hypothetical protein